MEFTQILTYTLASLTILSFVFSILLLVFYKNKVVSKFIKQNVIYLLLLVSFIAMFGSLYYSEIAKYNPCTLCWYQRILIYPQVFLLWLALILKDKQIVKYILLLCLLCIPLSTYHYLMQFSVVPESKCTAIGYSSSCADNFGASFGFVTIPLMALGAVLLNSVISFVYLKKVK